MRKTGKNLPASLMHIAPALEKRLAISPFAGYTGKMKLDFYRGGLRMVFEQGSLVSAADWRRPPYGSEARGGFPPLVFLQLLFGHRSIEALRQAFPDVWVSDEARLVLKALFPRDRRLSLHGDRIGAFAAGLVANQAGSECIFLHHHREGLK